MASTSKDVCSDDVFNDLSLLGKGGFGCVYTHKNRGTAGVRGEMNNEYITKVMNINNGYNEIEIGKLVSSISYYRHLYAPIVSYCNIHYSSRSRELPNKGNSNNMDMSKGNISPLTNDIINKEKDMDNNSPLMNDMKGGLAIENVIDTCNIKPKEEFKEGLRKGDYVSTKIPFVRGVELDTYLLRDDVSLQEILLLYDDLLIGYSILNQNDIIHYDIKDNNIMIRDGGDDGRDDDEGLALATDDDEGGGGGGETVIIDFGLSIRISHLKATIKEEKEEGTYLEGIRKRFRSHGPYYRNVDIMVLITLLDIEVGEWDKKVASVTVDIMKEVERFFCKDPIDGDITNTGSYNKHYIYDILTEEKVRKYKEERIRYYRDICSVEGGGGKTVRELIGDIIGTCFYWDNYALALCFLLLFNDRKGLELETDDRGGGDDWLLQPTTKEEDVKKIVDFMEDIVLSPIGVYPSLEETRYQLYDLFL